MRRLDMMILLLTVASLASAVDSQVVIPPGVLEKIPPKKIETKTKKPTTKPAGNSDSLSKLIRNFRRAAGDVAKRKAIAAKILKKGPEAAKLLRSVVAPDLSRRVTSYKKAFYSSGRQIGLEKLEKTGIEKINAWMEKFKSLGEVTKQSLKDTAGPAMDGLLEALVPSRLEVLKSSKKIPAMREEIIALDVILARCNKMLNPKSAASTLPKTLEQQETLLALMSTYMSRDHRKSVESDMKKFARMSFEEWHGFVHLNVLRTLLGLHPMRIEFKLSDTGRDHSKDMFTYKFFSHTSPRPGKKRFWDRAARYGVKASGECIAVGQPTGPTVVRAWFFSPAHHKLIMSQHSQVGIGKYFRYWTLMTGR
ncbi:MAG: CAP domain-containing protein [bacterium]|nr:CAP domain-containing protein [bacterium]